VSSVAYNARRNNQLGKKWEQWKSSNDYIDFTDMITITSTMKEPFPGRPLVGIYDEFRT